MKLALTLHPDFRCDAVQRIEVEVARASPGALILTYRLTGAISGLVLPPPAPPVRTDELWRATCLEAFLRPAPGEAYVELNFAPSTQWAAYSFSGYRAGMAPLDLAPPRIETRASDSGLDLHVALDLGATLANAGARLGLSAVIEEQTGAKSYWALAHPPGRPDFHHTAGLAAELLS